MNPTAVELDRDLLTPAEVGRIFGVDPKTVSRWGKAGKLPMVRTPGGHRRFPAAAVREAVREVVA